jgi:hypothetical protein
MSSRLQSAPRCGARTRRGSPCAAPAVRGRRRCRMHGGGVGSGAPRGNKNALKNGRFTREALEQRSSVNRLIRAGLEVLALLEEEDSEEP